MLSRMGIGKLLATGIVALLVVAATLGCVALYGIITLSQMQDQLAVHEVPQASAAHDIVAAVRRMQSAEGRALVAAYAKDQAELAAARQEFDAGAGTIRDSLSTLVPLAVEQHERQAMNALQKTLAAWSSGFDEQARLCAAGQAEEARRSAATAGPSRDILAVAAQFVTDSGVTMTELDEVTDRTAGYAKWMVGILLAISAAAGVTGCFVVRRLTARLRRLALEMSDASSQLASAAQQVSAASQSLAQGSSEQAASLQETSASSEEIHSVANRNTDNSRSAAGLAAQSQERSLETNAALGQMVTAMQEIGSSSDKIAKIIRIIDEIAFQTNILALNAAVEAARAGQAGQGFAVVADEVRNLAQRCAQAARDTSSLIEESITRSKEGQSRVDVVAESVQTTTEAAAQISTLVNEVSLGSEEQARGIEQISKTIAQLEQVTQQNASMAEQSAGAAQELSAQSVALRSVVAQLNQLVEGTSAMAAPPAAHEHQPAARIQGARRSVAMPR